MPSTFFGFKRPVKPHLLQGTGGIGPEVADLRRDIEEAFVALEAALAAGSGSFHLAFVNATLAAGILTVTHNLNQKYVAVQIYDNTDKMIIPDQVTLVGVNSLTVDLTSFGVLVGTWNAVVQK